MAESSNILDPQLLEILGWAKGAARANRVTELAPRHILLGTQCTEGGRSLLSGVFFALAALLRQISLAVLRRPAADRANTEPKDKSARTTEQAVGSYGSQEAGQSGRSDDLRQIGRRKSRQQSVGILMDLAPSARLVLSRRCAATKVTAESPPDEKDLQGAFTFRLNEREKSLDRDLLTTDHHRAGVRPRLAARMGRGATGTFSWNRAVAQPLD